jgi:hypothetical protein
MMFRFHVFVVVALLVVGCKPAQPSPTTTTEKIPNKHGDPLTNDARLGKPPPGTPSPHSPHDQTAPTPTVMTSKLAQLPSTSVVLSVDGVDYTKLQLDRSLRQFAASAGVSPELLDRQMQEAFEQPAYEKLIERHVLRAEAQRRQLWPNEAAVTKREQEMMATLPKGKTITDVYGLLGTDEAGFRADITTDLAIAALLENERNKLAQPTESELLAAYNKDPRAFDVPATTTVHHLVIRIPDKATPAEIAGLEARAKAARTRVVGKAASVFEKVAKEVSDDPAAKDNGGNVGSFFRGQMMPELDSVAFGLGVGAVSDVIRSSRGFHILRGGGVTQARQKPFAEVKDALQKRLHTTGLLAKTDALLDRLRAAATIVRVVEPLPSPLKPDDNGSQVSTWRPSMHNAEGAHMDGASDHAQDER